MPTGADATLVPPGPLSLSDGWASGGIATGTVAGTRSAIVGAPNANCGGSGSIGVAYLYDIAEGIGDIEPSDVFVPPVAVDPDGDSWNVFGWSNAIVETIFGTDRASFVVIGEPGREASDVHDGQVYVYRLGGGRPAGWSRPHHVDAQRSQLRRFSDQARDVVALGPAVPLIG